VARLGVQAAEALDHAHQVGVVHRDIKPANLMVEGQGQLWVTDFGLARIQSEAGLTATGDLVGALRYMSPEQALGKRVPIDHRTDVYSLGATLYEVLTLRPVFGGSDRQVVLRQLADEEPVRPRRLNRAVPAELETIVQKALEKNPTDRYATAQELADDLRRFLEDRPIRAKRPSWLHVARKWAQRHRPVVWAGTALLLVLMFLGGLNGIWWAEKRSEAERNAERILADIRPWQAEGKWPEALAVIQPAVALADGGAINVRLARSVRQRRADLEMAEALDDIRLQRTAATERASAFAEADAAYARAFRDHDIDVLTLVPEEAAERIRRSSIPAELASALDDWAFMCRGRQSQRAPTTWKQLLAIARAADPDPQRNRVREAFEHLTPKDAKAAKELAWSVPVSGLRPGTLLLLGKILNLVGADDELTALMRKSQRERPEDFNFNYDLALQLVPLPSPQRDEVIRFLTAAVALRPRSAAVHFNLGVEWERLEAWDDAIAAYERAIELKPDYGEAYNNLGGIYLRKGNLDRGIACERRGVELKPSSQHYASLAAALARKGDLDGALTACREAVRLDPQNPIAVGNLEGLLQQAGALDKAVVVKQEAIQLYDQLAKDVPDNPNYRRGQAESRGNLALALAALDRLPQAVSTYQASVTIWKRLAEEFPNVPEYRRGMAGTHQNLGLALQQLRRPNEAEDAFNAATAVFERLAKDYPGIPDNRIGLAGSLNNLWHLVKDTSRRADAETAMRKSLAVQESLVKDFPGLTEQRHALAAGYRDLGVGLMEWGRPADAEQLVDKALHVEKQLADEFPHTPEHRWLLGNCYLIRGFLLQGKHQAADAEDAFRSGLDILEKLCAEFPADARYRAELAGGYNRLGLFLRGLERRDKAEKAYRQAWEVYAKLTRDFPKVPDYTVQLGGICCHLGREIRDEGRPEDALVWFNRGIEALEPLLRAEPPSATARLFLRNTHWNRAKALVLLKRDAAALQDWERARALVEKDLPFEIPLGRALALARLGKHEAATAAADELARVPGITALLLVEVARVYALSAAAAGKDGGLRDRYGSRAVTLLRQAAQKGYRDERYLKEDSDLESLRGRPDFQKLLA
jgi:tetratricopeptide (TPR) repeat protein